MFRTMLKSKIHRATVTDTDPSGSDSITVDEALLDAADLLPGELVAVVDITGGERLETYVVAGERGSGVVRVNGAATRRLHRGDLIIMIGYGVMAEPEAPEYLPRILHVDPSNRVLAGGHDPGEAVPGMAGGVVRGDGNHPA